MIRKIRPTAAWLLILGIGAAAMASATSARLVGKVVDQAGAPVQGAMVLVQTQEGGREVRRVTNKKGEFKLQVSDPELDHLIAIGKEGYATIQEQIEFEDGGVTEGTWTLVEGAAGQEGAAPGSIDAPARLSRTYEEALEAYNGGEYDVAIEKFGEIVESNPEIPEPHLGLALSNLQKGEHAAALEHVDQYLELKPGDNMGLRARYRAYRDMGDRENEVAALDALIAVDSSPEVARFVFNEGVAQLQAGDLQAAAGRFHQVNEMDPDLDPAINALARVYYDMGDYEQSMSWANQMLERQPDNAEIMGLMYLMYVSQGETAKAEELFSSMQTASPEFVSGVLYRQGVNYFNDGKLAQARSIFEGVLATIPDHPGAHYSLALCEMNDGNTAEAKRLLERFLELDPDNPEAGVAREMLGSL